MRFCIPIILVSFHTACTLLIQSVCFQVPVGHSVLYAARAVSEDEDSCWKSPKPVLKRPPAGFSVSKGSNRCPAQVNYNVVDDEVLNLRCLLGGGRKLIRHDCAGEDPPSLEVVFTRDLDRPQMVLHDALSVDNGASWSVVGPLSYDPENFRDRNHVIGFNGGVTHIVYTEQFGNPESGLTNMYWIDDQFTCLGTFPSMTEITQVDSLDEFYPMLAWVEPSTVYMSFIDFAHGNPNITYFKKSTDNGKTWSDNLNITDTIEAEDFDIGGMDGPLMIDADGEFIAALAWVVLDDAWADSNGFCDNCVYPAYTQSTDGGDTWDPLRLVWGTDITAYPHGHSGDPEFDQTISYVGGVDGYWWTFGAINYCQDKCAITSDGLVHLVYTMLDTTYGYEALFHSIVDDGTITNYHIGFPEDPELSGESGVAFMSSIAKADDGHIVVGWTEFIQPDGLGDICMHAIPAGEGRGPDGPVNVTDRPEDIVYQRIVDKTVPTGNPYEWYVDWVFEFYGEGGNAADSTLWHLQATYVLPPVDIEIPDEKDSGAGRVVILDQNYPNPFNPATVISFGIGGNPIGKQHVTVKIYNLRGRLMRTLIDSELAPGSHKVIWDGRDDGGETVSSGIYFYTLRIGDRIRVKKMTVQK
ncbi:MAG: FlgD immunoglobulin-like domain containing protein [Candidatus Glassbacteria bacterium]